MGALRGLTAAAVVLATGACGAGASGRAAYPAVPEDPYPTSATTTTTTAADGGIPAKLRTCKRGEFGVDFTGILRNTGSSPASVLIAVEILDQDGTRVDEGYASAERVAPGQRAEFEGVGIKGPEELPARVRCRILTVENVPE